MRHQYSVLLYGTKMAMRSKFDRMKDGESPAAGGGSPAAPVVSPAPTSPVGTAPASTTGTPAVTPSPGAQPGTQPQPIEDGNWRELRTKYDAATARNRVLDGLGVPESELSGVVTQWKAVHSEANTLATELGYDEADFKEAFAADPIKTLSYLRSEKAEAATRTQVPRQQGETTEDYAQRIKDEVSKQTKPFTEHINRQISDAVTARVGVEFNTAVKAALPNAPQQVIDLIDDYVSEALTYNTDALIAMKTKGDFSAVHDMTKLVAGRLQSVFAEWVKAETARTGGRAPVAGQAGTSGAKRPTLDEMIEDPSLINAKYV